MRAASPVISLSFAGCLLASAPAHGMGFGRVVNGTQLGQPLDFSAVVKLDADESLARECVFAEVASGDNRIPPGLVRVTLAGVPGETDRVVRVTTGTPIDEPFVTVNVTLGCTSRVTRQFVAFVDPPGLALAPAAAGPAAVTAPPVAGDERMPVERRPGGTAPVPRREADPRVATGRVAPPAEAARKRAVPERPVAAAGPRLQLDAPAVAVAVAAPAAVASAAPVPPVAAASAAEEQAEALARERKRIQSLEDELAALRAESKAQRQALASLQVQVGGTRSQRYANPLVYTLAALCLLMTTVVCALLGRRSRDRAAARWLTSEMLARSAVPPRPQPAATVLPVPDAAPADAAPPAPPAPPVATAASAPARAPAAARAQTVDEMIDLEQQADFFVVLGQDDAAIELLNGHVAAGDDGAASPVPLLKLLELHHRVGDRAAYEQVRGRVDRHFNARTPAFDAAAVPGRTLDDHPGIVARLQALWSQPAKALEAIDGLVLRRQPSDEAFDLPAFRELLFLRSIATDHAGRAEIDAGKPAEAVRAGRPAVLPAAASPAKTTSTRPLDVDLSAAPVRPLAVAPVAARRSPALAAVAAQFDSAETVPAALRRSSGYADESAFVDLELEFPGLAAEPSLPR